MKNTLPASQNLTIQSKFIAFRYSSTSPTQRSSDFIGFIIFWLLSLPTMWLPIEKARWFFHAKAIVAPIGGFTFLIWSLVKAGGGGEIIHQKATLTGTAAVWPMLTAIMSCMSNMATLVTNNSDITSYAAQPSNAVLPQLITLPLGFTITSLIGIFIASSSGVIYGKVIWDPIENLGMMLEGNPNGATRFGVVVIAACFVYVQLILNLSANSIGAGCDMTALLPRWINIRRGSYICALLGIAINPWQLFKSSNAFTTYLSAYSVLLSSVAGIMICDYYLVRKGNYRVTDLFTNSHKGWYWYWKGCNPRAVVAYLCGIAPNMPGFVAAVSPSTKMPIAATRIYTLSWWVGVIVGGGVYYILNRIWPAAGAFPERFQEVDLSEYEEYGFANSPKWTDGSPTYTSYAQSRSDQGDLAREDSYDKSDVEKSHGGRSQVVDVPELR
jgi:NCS1 family nucleobase:cation symporter-1